MLSTPGLIHDIESRNIDDLYIEIGRYSDSSLNRRYAIATGHYIEGRHRRPLYSEKLSPRRAFWPAECHLLYLLTVGATSLRLVKEAIDIGSGKHIIAKKGFNQPMRGIKTKKIRLKSHV